MPMPITALDGDTVLILSLALAKKLLIKRSASKCKLNTLQQTFPILKRIGSIFDKVVEYDNFVLADHNARKNKKHYK